MPKIAITTSSFGQIENYFFNELRSLGFELIKNPFGRRLTENEVVEILSGDVVAMIAGVEPLSKKVITLSSSLRVISRCGIGLDNVDLNEAEARDIRVYNTPDAPTKAVAEFTIALILNSLRRVSEADRVLRSGGWKQLMGKALNSQTIGIIGFGRVGRRVASLARSFGANVVAHDIQQEGLTVIEGVDLLSLNSLLKISDIVSLHVPYSAETHHLINSKRFALMKNDAILINTSRGGLVDEAALFHALQNKLIGGAAIDAFESEPYMGQLTTFENVLLTSHMGSYSLESRNLQEIESIENLRKGMQLQGLLA
jgi:D-3-phosphoglycerate dehydrogenase